MSSFESEVFHDDVGHRFCIDLEIHLAAQFDVGRIRVFLACGPVQKFVGQFVDDGAQLAFAGRLVVDGDFAALAIASGAACILAGRDIDLLFCGELQGSVAERDGLLGVLDVLRHPPVLAGRLERLLARILALPFGESIAFQRLGCRDVEHSTEFESEALLFIRTGRRVLELFDHRNEDGELLGAGLHLAAVLVTPVVVAGDVGGLAMALEPDQHLIVEAVPPKLGAECEEVLEEGLFLGLIHLCGEFVEVVGDHLIHHVHALVGRRSLEVGLDLVGHVLDCIGRRVACRDGLIGGCWRIGLDHRRTCWLARNGSFRRRSHGRSGWSSRVRSGCRSPDHGIDDVQPLEIHGDAGGSGQGLHFSPGFGKLLWGSDKFGVGSLEVGVAVQFRQVQADGILDLLVFLRSVAPATDGQEQPCFATVHEGHELAGLHEEAGKD